MTGFIFLTTSTPTIRVSRPERERPEPFGLHSLDVLKIIRHIFRKQNVVAMDLVEIAPPLDKNDLTTWLGLKTLYEIFEILIDGRSQR